MGNENRASMLKIRLTKSEMNALKERAGAEGLSLSAWGRARLLSVPDEAAQIIGTMRRAIFLEAAKLEMMPEAELRAALELEAAVNASILSEREG
ncbi:hypothetical protein Rvan_1893 [Rhodomicrobium vannielii ATCC 17100]|uniref:Uncharacterized protein n=1 Tax=Rhodomicrobium vannielii (strain ATCC 17100 / DSM 162 / LMG 4299 / NCIMB 10020 / ATH 3.1.1) TaxID=648757 RepID=E3I095_RHOVT|nr:hypothetical protein Rvan_1893 [Rhodomicrobium vannielii ATCC 17100]